MCGTATLMDRKKNCRTFFNYSEEQSRFALLDCSMIWIALGTAVYGYTKLLCEPQPVRRTMGELRWFPCLSSSKMSLN